MEPGFGNVTRVRRSEARLGADASRMPSSGAATLGYGEAAVPRRVFLVPRTLFVAALVSGVVCGCSSEELLTLGKAKTLPASSEAGATSQDSESSSDSSTVSSDASVPPPFPLVFGAPVLVEELHSALGDDNPTLTWDMLEIYFSSKRGEEDTDLWRAHRTTVDEPFSEPVFLEELSSPEFDTSPAVDGDGLTFWFSSAREDGQGGLDIIRVTRANREEAWGEPSLVVELNSEWDDIPRPTGADGRIMPLASRRGSETDTYLTYFAVRPNTEQPFEEITLVPELAPEGAVAADAFLTADGLTLLYSLVLPDQLAELYMTTRASLLEPFREAVPLASLNTESEERDPWLSPDGKTLYFASDRDGEMAIYRADLLP